MSDIKLRTRYKCYGCHEEFVTMEEAAEHFEKFGRPHGVHKIKRRK